MGKLRRTSEELHFLNYVNIFFWVIVLLLLLFIGLAWLVGKILTYTRLRALYHEVKWLVQLKLVWYHSNWCRTVYKNVHKRDYNNAPKKRTRIIRKVVRMRYANMKRYGKG